MTDASMMGPTSSSIDAKPTVTPDAIPVVIAVA
jgi:hypothetical protein